MAGMYKDGYSRYTVQSHRRPSSLLRTKEEGCQYEDQKLIQYLRFIKQQDSNSDRANEVSYHFAHLGEMMEMRLN